MIDKLYGPMQPLVQQFLKEAKKAGIDLLVTDGYRSNAEQDALYAQGRTKPGKIVTNARGGQSFHNYGLAIDVVDRVRGYNGTDWKKLGEIARSIGLEHGVIPGTKYGDGSFFDAPHFQFTRGLSIADVAAGKRPEPITPMPLPEKPQPNNEEDDMLHLKLKENLTLHPVPQYKGSKVTWYKWYVMKHNDKDPKEVVYEVAKSDLFNTLMLFDFEVGKKIEPGYIRGLTGYAESYKWDVNSFIEKYPTWFTREQ